MRSVLQTVVRCLAVALLTGLSQLCLAVDTCTPVRPASLSPSAVDQVVIRQVAEALGIPPSSVDSTKTIAQLDRSDNAIIRYAFVVGGISEALAFDAAAAFHQANLASGKRHPMEGVSVGLMQSLARKAYASGVDSAPPLVLEGTTYGTRRFTVTVPSHPPGWSLLLCNHDQYAFRLVDANSASVYTAVARDINLEPFTTEEAFLLQIRSAAAAQAR